MSVVDDVKARLDIVEVISGYTSLQKAGRNYKALCPFHQEKTPSFVVFPDTQTWRCFGACGEGGDVFSFVMKNEGWDFSETLRELARRAGVDLQPRTPEQSQQDAQMDRLRGLLEETARFFHKQLRDAEGAQIARDYVLNRSLSQETAETFMLGYAPDDWRQALHHLQMLGYKQDEIVDAGVAIRNDKGNVYDRFRHRLVIPIRDSRGRTVGFGARAFAKEDNPKYLNSPQGPLFDKSKLLYGLDTARRAIRETETVVVVEGYMDVMQAYQAGFPNIVAQMGTALTEEHLRQLARYAERIILALDADTAGINATMRGLTVAQQTLDGKALNRTFDPSGMIRYTGRLNVDLRVISLPEGQDPDDLIRTTPEAWPALLEHAQPVANYVIEQATAHLNDLSSLQEREQVAQALLPILITTESDVEQSGNIQALARKVRIDERTLIQWGIERQPIKARDMPTQQKRRKLADRPARITVSRPPGQSAVREKRYFNLLLSEPDWLFETRRKLRELQNNDPALREPLAPTHAGDFTRSDYQAIFRTFEQALDEGDTDPIEYLYHYLPPELVAVVDDLRVPPLDAFQQTLSGTLGGEYRGIRREQMQNHTNNEPDLRLFIQKTLELRHSHLERQSQELYFLQQEAQDQNAEAYHVHMSAITRARQLIAKALQTMHGLQRET